MDRYFFSWRDVVNAEPNDPVEGYQQNYFDANIACKCVGDCEIQPGEDLALANICHFDYLDNARMLYAVSDWETGGRGVYDPM